MSRDCTQTKKVLKLSSVAKLLQYLSENQYRDTLSENFCEKNYGTHSDTTKNFIILYCYNIVS